MFEKPTSTLDYIWDVIRRQNNEIALLKTQLKEQEAELHALQVENDDLYNSENVYISALLKEKFLWFDRARYAKGIIWKLIDYYRDISFGKWNALPTWVRREISK